MLFFLTLTSVSDKSCRQNQNTHFMFNNFSFENRFFYKVKWKNMAHPDRPQMPTIEGYTHTHRIRNTYCSSTATMVSRKALNVALCARCLSASCIHIPTSPMSLVLKLVLLAAPYSEPSGSRWIFTYSQFPLNKRCRISFVYHVCVSKIYFICKNIISKTSRNRLHPFRLIGTGKVPVYTMKAYRGNRGTAPLILNLGARLSAPDA
jgi:hypothetical protein